MWLLGDIVTDFFLDISFLGKFNNIVSYSKLALFRENCHGSENSPESNPSKSTLKHVLKVTTNVLRFLLCLFLEELQTWRLFIINKHIGRPVETVGRQRNQFDLLFFIYTRSHFCMRLQSAYMYQENNGWAWFSDTDGNFWTDCNGFCVRCTADFSCFCFLSYDPVYFL